MSESDGVDEAIEGLSRTGIAVAARLGEQLARMREQSLREQQAADEQRARELQVRYESQRKAAQAQLAPTAEDRWWDQARPQDIERVHETATAWKQFDPAAQEAAERIRREVKERYGVDADNPGAHDRAVSEALAQAERDRAEADRQRSAGERNGAEAAAVIGASEREDRNRETAVESENNAAREAEPLYDSEERRQSFAASLDGKADSETIRARILADRDQATPPSAAVEGEPRKVRNPAKRGAGTVRQQKVRAERSR
ncbi:hypothetical protein P4U43_08060 [Arthrobacter sp. EH-1B-1]|uniref:Colicin import membrane protein n=1 Tax=Arthrobacter vasquezii TaxID=2977629 RepID=A0ABT6CVD8_9MICC|nr:hypothetical protein [Arthrobacter vasquezii]MDF9277741.1 hypothetical protein [Arthrobacter vasquezii]